MPEVATMNFNAFAFPYNPDRIQIDYDRTLVRHCIPFGSPVLQELETLPRIVRGEGEWIGPQCLARFAQLEAEFLRGGIGRLICPIIGPLSAYFVSLRAIGKPGPLALRYSFEFLESLAPSTPVSKVSWQPSGSDGLPAGLAWLGGES